MSLAVAMEVQQREGGSWSRVGEASEPQGSITSDGPNGRQVYLFGVRDGQPGVWRSVGGVDTGDPQLRVITTLGLEELSKLDEPFLLVLERRDRGTIRLRFRAIRDEEL